MAHRKVIKHQVASSNNKILYARGGWHPGQPSLSTRTHPWRISAPRLHSFPSPDSQILRHLWVKPSNDAFTFHRAENVFHDWYNWAAIELAFTQATALRTHVAPQTARRLPNTPLHGVLHDLLLLPSHPPGSAYVSTSELLPHPHLFRVGF